MIAFHFLEPWYWTSDSDFRNNPISLLLMKVISLTLIRKEGVQLHRPRKRGAGTRLHQGY